MTETVKLCFPHLNSSCRRPETNTGSKLIYILLSCVSVLTVALNLLVIISISYFRQVALDLHMDILLLLSLYWYMLVGDLCSYTVFLCFFLSFKRHIDDVIIFSDCRRLHRPTNSLLLSLAISDFLIGLVVMPVEIILTQTCWMLGDFLCTLYYFFPITIVTASVGNILLISVDRYVAICDPLHYTTKITSRNISVCICLSWMLSTFFSVGLLYDSLKQQNRSSSCYGECVVNINGIVDLTIGFIIPIGIIILLCARVFVTAASQARAMRSHTAAITLQQYAKTTATKSEIKAARTLGVLIVVFLMCYSPYYCVSFTGYNILVGSSTEAFMIFLLYFNSCLNPVIYVCCYPWFKKAVRYIVTLKILQPDSCEANIL